MTSEDAARDRLIYDDLVRFCGELRASIASMVSKSQTILSMSVALVIGYFVISDRAIGKISIRELIGIGIFVAGTALFLHIAFLQINYKTNRLGWRHLAVPLRETSRTSIALMLELAEQLNKAHANYRKYYDRALLIWGICLLGGIAQVVWGRLY